MYFTKESQLNDLLERIGFKLQLDKTRNERAKSSYETLCNWIKKDGQYFGKYKLDFYAQGSYRTRTTVKPLNGEEFDLDFVMEMNSDWQNENPLNVLKQLERRLKESAVYKDMIEVKTRCIRVNYANDFHIDILPAFPENHLSFDDKIRVPDRDLKDWTDSNPKGYSKWFDDISNKVNTVFLEKSANASIEPLPVTPPYDYVQPLRRSIQLIKRFRDIHYKDKSQSAPRSIVLTTLAASHYKGDSSAYEAIINILNGIQTDISNSGKRPLIIYNPMNSKENLSEKWDEDKTLYQDFCAFIDYFSNEWASLSTLESLEEKAEVLKELFGETISKEVIREQTEYINELRNNGNLGINTSNGNLVAISSIYNTPGSTKVVQKNTFYGE